MGFRPILLVAVALALVTAGCLGNVQAAPGAAATATVDDPAGPTVSVSASGEVTADPDLAVVRVTVESTADSAGTARQQVAADAERMREALVDAGVPADAVTTRSFAIYPEYDFSERERELVGYRAVHAFDVELTDVDRAGEVIDLAVDNGATRVDGVLFTLAADTRADLREQALDAAMTAARADADAIATAGGLTVTGVHTASTSGGVSGPFPGPVFAEARADGAGTTISPGTVTVTATVNVVYTAESA